jgi:hypothetical protein
MRSEMPSIDKQADAQWRGTPDHIDAPVTVAGGAAMLVWLTLIT